MDHVLVGAFDGSPAPDPDEVAAWRWTAFERLREEVAQEPDAFTAWLRVLLEDETHARMLEEACRTI